MMNFKYYLNEGLIKLPEQMFREGNSKIISAICSNAITDIEKLEQNPATRMVIRNIKNLAAKHNATIKTIVKKLVRSKEKLEKVYNDLPQKYKDQAEKINGPLILSLDWIGKGRLTNKNANALYRNTEDGNVIIGISSIVQLNWKKLFDSQDAEEIIEIFSNRVDRILGSFEHELTHFVQYKILSKFKKSGTESDILSKDKRDLYYGADIEFDPQIKSELGHYRKQEKDNLDIRLKTPRSVLLAYFVGAKELDSKTDIHKEAGYIKPSNFFLSLKKHNSDKWKKAIKLFTQELEKRYP